MWVVYISLHILFESAGNILDQYLGEELGQVIVVYFMSTVGCFVGICYFLFFGSIPTNIFFYFFAFTLGGLYYFAVEYWFRSMRGGHPLITSTFGYFNVIISVLMGLFFLDEGITFTQYLGIFSLFLGGIFLKKSFEVPGEDKSNLEKTLEGFLHNMDIIADDHLKKKGHVSVEDFFAGVPISKIIYFAILHALFIGVYDFFTKIATDTYNLPASELYWASKVTLLFFACLFLHKYFWKYKIFMENIVKERKKKHFFFTCIEFVEILSMYFLFLAISDGKLGIVRGLSCLVPVFVWGGSILYNKYKKQDICWKQEAKKLIALIPICIGIVLIV